MCGGGGSNKAAAAAARSERERRARVADSVAIIRSLFSGNRRESQYRNLRQDVYDFNFDNLSRDRELAELELKQNVARRGLAGGSADVDAFQTLNRNFNDALLNVASHADSRASSLRDSDERARLNLISQAQQDIGSGALNEAGLRRLQSNVETAKNQDRLAATGDLFRGISLTSGAANTGFQTGDNRRIERGRDKYNTFYPAGRKESSGVITSIGR